MNVTVLTPELMKMFEASLSAQIERGRGIKVVWSTASGWVEREGYCPTCGSTDCPNLKNASAMCPGPAP